MNQTPTPTPGEWAAGLGRVKELDGAFLCVGVVNADDSWQPVAILAPEAAINFEDFANANLIVAAKDLLADLIEAAATLRRYEALHRAKGTDDGAAKAEANAALAARFEATIDKAVGVQL